MSNALLYLIAILLLIVLLLTISILLVLLWSAVLFLQNFMPYISIEEKKHSKKKFSVGNVDEENENLKVKSKLRTVELSAIKKAYTTKDPESWTEQWFENQSADDISNGNETSEKDIVYINEFSENEIKEFDEQTLMGIIKGDISAYITQIGIIDPKKGKRYGYEALFGENPTGHLGIYHISEGIYYIIPAEEKFDYAEYACGGIGNCFNTNREIEAGMQYRIVGIKEPCKMKREASGKYSILEEGKISVVEIQF